jgi:HK97 family phage major capsid protein
MHNVEQLKARLSELHQAVDTRLKACERGEITGKALGQYVDKAETEANEIKATIKSLQQARKWSTAGAPEAGTTGQPSGTGNTGSGIKVKKFNAPDPLQATEQQWFELFNAAQRRMGGYTARIGETTTKSLGSGDLKMKAPFGEGAVGSLLPPVLLPDAYQLPYEPDRLFTAFPGVQAEGQSVTFLMHESNTGQAGAVAELAEKPQLGMQVSPKTVEFTVIGALQTFSLQAIRDFDSFMSFAPAELQRAVINAETDQVVNGDGTGADMLGILATPGVLKRAVGADTPVDAIVSAFNDLRVGPSFGTADLVAMHPSTWNYVRLQKNQYGSYLLLQNTPNQIGTMNDLFGVNVVVNTMIPEGTAIVFDTTKSIKSWTRWGLEVMLNQFGTYEFENNAVTWRVEERVAIGVFRPTNICVVTGLVPGGS